MKIKITLLALLFTNSVIDSLSARQYIQEYDQVNKLTMVRGESDQNKTRLNDQAYHPMKWATSVTINPSIVWREGEWATKGSPGASLTFKGEVPDACCGKHATVNINTSWGGEKELCINHAAVTIGNMITIGHTTSIFSYEKGDSALLISPSPVVLQIRYQHKFDWLHFGYAIEKPLSLEVGLFNKAEKKYDKDRDKEKPFFNELNNDKKRPFKIRNSFPAFGFNIGVITDHFNIAFNGLGRLADYTHSNDPDAKQLPIKSCLTWGSHLGVHYQLVPKKITIAAQGAYVYGLGDYLPGLAAIQKDEGRKEMSAAYYINEVTPSLSLIDAFGFGGTLEYTVTPQWTFSFRGSYLTTLQDSNKPPIAFLSQWNLVPKVSYQINKYLAVSGGYTLTQENRIDSRETKSPEHNLSGSIKFSL